MKNCDKCNKAIPENNEILGINPDALCKCPTSLGEWQLCPKCNGEGICDTIGISNNTSRNCPVCNGKKILARPLIN